MARCRDCERKAVVGGLCSLHTGRRCKCGLTCRLTVCSVCGHGTHLKKMELNVKSMLEADAALDAFVHNKRVPGTRHAPDFMWEHSCYSVILEVDEYGHKSYDKCKEHKRLVDISLKMRKELVVVRLHVPAPVHVIESCMAVLRTILQDRYAEVMHCDMIKTLYLFDGMVMAGPDRLLSNAPANEYERAP